ncbi:hypothetical protein EG68_11844 [Paragonimus skrjabini miyazakii]|uniref:Uncharacterized protein n=1 Tax=Paragonimus skrjabini miyazakii TaxID=59628 RepID=A0A8S9YDU8_9TREM|nr:hypothetical protein EG68_11844 [Paragonimus skrjabini miyazakii]
MWDQFRGCPKRELPSIVLKCGLTFIGMHNDCNVTGRSIEPKTYFKRIPRPWERYVTVGRHRMIRNDLAFGFQQSRTRMIHQSMFLGVLRMYHPTLPRDSRTLMGTPRECPKRHTGPATDTARSRNLSACHKLLLAHEALPPTTAQYAVIDLVRTNSYVDARAVERETVEQSSDATSDCTSRRTNFNTQYIERKRVPLWYSSDDDCDYRESQEKKSGSRQASSVYPEPPSPQLLHPTMLHSPQRTPIVGPSTVRMPVFHDLPSLLIPKDAAVQ